MSVSIVHSLFHRVVYFYHDMTRTQKYQQRPQLAEQNKVRKERDSVGEFDVPANAYYGANTMREMGVIP